MRILKKAIQQGKGFVYLLIDEQDDLWYLYNIIIPGDQIRTVTCRKVKKTTNTGASTCDIKTRNQLQKVEKVDYQDDDDQIVLQIKGKCCQENEFVNLGQYHTFKIETGQKISVSKQQWDKFNLKMLHDSVDNQQKNDIKALIMDEGVAHLCYQSQNTFRIKQKIEVNIPKKRNDGNQGYNKKIDEFFKQCFQMIQQIDFQNTKCLIIASPGFVKDNFKKFCIEQSNQEQFKSFKEYSKQFLLVHSANGYINCLDDILLDPKVQNQLCNTSYLNEIKLFEKFQKTLEKDEDKVCYSSKYVIEASMNQAIDELMITDTLFRTRNFKQRNIYNNLCDQVKQNGGNVHIFSSKLYTGEKVDQLGGVAAILRFPLNLDYLDDKEEIQFQDDTNDQEISNIEINHEFKSFDFD